MSKPKFKVGDLVRVVVFSYEPEEVGIIIRQLNWREMIEVTYDRGQIMWHIHFPDTDIIKPYAEKWLTLVKN
tara:strand:- start:972 stop:1187 length:216 start_codon:yes stop_codon:yes gene_type:complete